MSSLVSAVNSRGFAHEIDSLAAPTNGDSQPVRPWPQTAYSQADTKLFPLNLRALEWTEFPAAGFSAPACGVIYRRHQRPEKGLPIGGLDTGRLNLDTDGTFGLCSIFNSILPQRGPLKVPFLGMSVGKRVWLLSDPYPRDSSGRYMLAGVQTPTEIHFWGHYPVADLEYELVDSPVGVGLRAWAPFLPGNSKISNTPGAVFEVRLRNLTNSPQEVWLAFSFPGPSQAEAQISPHSPREKLSTPPSAWGAVAAESVRALREETRGEFSGLIVSSEKVKDIGYALGVAGDEPLMVGGGLAQTDSASPSASAWLTIDTELPRAEEKDFSASISISRALGPGEEKTVRFILAWYAPIWIGEGPHSFTHMYTTRYKGALNVAQFLCREHESLLRRVLAWQQVIYSEGKLPIWLRDSLVNIFHLFAAHSLWAAARPPVGPWCQPEDGLFGMIQGLVEFAGMELLGDSWYANAPLPMFFPDLMLSTLRGYRAYQFANGAVAGSWGGSGSAAAGGYEPTSGIDMASPSPGYQTATNGPFYVDLVDRYWQRTGNEDFLKEFYPSVKRNTLYTMQLRPEDGPDGIVSVPSGNVDPYRPWVKEGYRTKLIGGIPQFGMGPHIAGFHLAQLRMADRMAETVGDGKFAQQCRDWFEEGSLSVENKLWAGDYYRFYCEPKTGRKSDNVFVYQFDGQWMVRFHGLAGVFQSERVRTSLDTIKRTCVAATPYGAANLTRPDGSFVNDEGYGPYGFVFPEVMMLAMTYMYEGDKEFGLELARRCIHDVTINLRLVWDQPNIIRGDNGEREFGQEITQNMNLWAMPAAIEGIDIKAFCGRGHLVDRIIKAAASLA